MGYWVGFDVGKVFHWVCVLDNEGKEVLCRRVEATEEDLEPSCSQIEQLGGERTVGIDLLGGPATLLEAVLLERGESVFHVPGIPLNRGPATPTLARPRVTPKTLISSPINSGSGAVCCTRSAPGTRPPPRRCGCSSPTAGISAPREQTRRAARLREVLLGVFPGLEATLDLKREGALLAVTKVATPASARKHRHVCCGGSRRGAFARLRISLSGSLRLPKPSAANCPPPRVWPRS